MAWTAGRTAPSAAVLLTFALAAALGWTDGLRGALGRLAAAALLIGAWHAIRRRAADDLADPSSPWPWLARSALAAGIGSALAAPCLALGTWSTLARDLTDPVFSAFAVGATLLAYQGVVRWNRYRVGVVGPEDWINGIATILAGTAAVLSLRPSLLGSPATILEAAEVSAGLLVLGTMLTVAGLAGLRRDPRFWAVFGALTLVLVAEAVGLLRPEFDPGTGVAWAMTGAACLLWARHVPPRARGQRHPASARATAFGSVTVLVASLAVIGGEQTAALVRAELGLRVIPTILAGIAATAAILRLAGLVRDHSLLSVSRQEARTDELTGLGNRRALLERLAEGAGRPDVSLVLVDLDEFKDVNDRHGHPVGDQLLRVVGACLRAATPADGLAARMGGDEFAIVIEGGEAACVEVAAAVQDRLAAARLPDVPTVRVGASIGIAAGDVGAGTEDLLWRADVALYEGKRAGGLVVVYDELLGAASHDRRRLTDELRAALGGDPAGLEQFAVWFQPQLDALRDTPTAVEALVRWEHPVRGLLGPAAFLDVVDAEGLMPALSAHVLRTACRVAAPWIHDGAISRVAVNLAPSVLAGPEIVALVGDAVLGNGLTPSNVVLEVTEGAVIADDSPALDNAAALAERGIALSIDDYGTGYSSLTRLHHLPVDEIKLDREFTRDLQTDRRAQIIVTATIDLAHRLGQRVIAEGVEDTTTLRFLAEVGCDEIQGWVHAPAMTAADLTTWLAARRRVRARVPGQRPA